MDGEELYDFYSTLQARASVTIDDWDVLDATEQAVWNELARLTSPELSDEAKQIQGAG